MPPAFPLTFPSVDSRLFRFGQAEVALKPYIGAGVDADFSAGHMGATGAKFEVHFDRKIHEIECQQVLAPVAAVVIGESVDITATFMQTNLANLKQLYGMGSVNLVNAAPILVGGLTSSLNGTLFVGDDQNTTFYQMLVRMPGILGNNPPTTYNAHLRYYQFYKVLVASIGPASADKAGSDSAIQIKFKCLADTSCLAIATKPSLFAIFDT